MGLDLIELQLHLEREFGVPIEQHTSTDWETLDSVANLVVRECSRAGKSIEFKQAFDVVVQTVGNNFRVSRNKLKQGARLREDLRLIG
jgi:hypothetical protein